MATNRARVTYPNQFIICINKERYVADFLQVGIYEWQEAFQTLPRISFGLYLYLCGNKDGFNYALSSVAVQQALGVSDSSYRRAVEDLLAAGYLIMENDKKNKMYFYTSPQPTDYVKKDRKKKEKEEVTPAAPEVERFDYDYDNMPRNWSPSEYAWVD